MIIIFSAINLIVNLVQSIRLLLDRRAIVLPEDLKDIYYSNFNKMRPNEFIKIYKLADLKASVKGEELIKENTPVQELMLIKSGTAHVNQDDICIASVSSGFFAGEMSFLSDSMANASIVVSSKELSYLSWKKEVLENMHLKNKELYEKFKQALAVNVILKVDNQAHHQ